MSSSHVAHEGQHAALSNAQLLSSILLDIGASDFLQKFIDDDQDDACIPSYRNPGKISRSYGLPPSVASEFVEKCRARAGAQLAGDSASVSLSSSGSPQQPGAASAPVDADSAALPSQSPTLPPHPPNSSVQRPSLNPFNSPMSAAGLLDCYDVFLSYRWTGSFDEDLTLGLFKNLSADVLGPSGREIKVFLDKRRLQDGRNFQDDFADALLKTSLPVVILSTAALQRMVNLQADSAIDNLLLEWTLIVELLLSKTITYCLPIIIGTYNPSAPSCAAVIEDFFKDAVKAADGSVFYSGIDSLPDVSVTSIILKVRRMLQQHQLPQSPCLSSHTVRSVVKHLSLHQAVFASKLFDDQKFQAVPASHAKEEVTRTVVEHCSGRIRSILERIEDNQAKVVASCSTAPGRHHST
jgi:hypothetical protein